MEDEHRADEILARWREVERELERATPGSPEAEALQFEAAQLRDEYQALVEQTLTSVPNPSATQP
jgi:hypothetical protein